jgi:hypothetical protein
LCIFFTNPEDASFLDCVSVRRMICTYVYMYVLSILLALFKKVLHSCMLCMSRF